MQLSAQTMPLAAAFAKSQPVMATWLPIHGCSRKEVIPIEISGQALATFSYTCELLFAIALMQSSSKPRLSSYLFNRFNSVLQLGSDLKQQDYPEYIHALEIKAKSWLHGNLRDFS